MEKRILPNFESEAEEAKWWFDNQDEIAKDFAQAFAEGRLRRRTEPRTSPIRLTGTLVRLRDEGYCFIHVRGGVEHYCNINSMRHRAEWVEGQTVSFVPGKPPDGKAPPAFDVVAVMKDTRPAFMT